MNKIVAGLVFVCLGLGSTSSVMEVGPSEVVSIGLADNRRATITREKLVLLQKHSDSTQQQLGKSLNEFHFPLLLRLNLLLYEVGLRDLMIARKSIVLASTLNNEAFYSSAIF